MGNDANNETTTEPMDEAGAEEQSREERAFTLYCQGMRVTEIALTLAVSETTIRRWLRARLETLAHEERAERAAEEPDRHEGARYLSIALSAQREVARLQGLYYRIGREPAPVEITLTRRPESPDAPDTSESPDAPDTAERQ